MRGFKQQEKGITLASVWRMEHREWGAGKNAMAVVQVRDDSVLYWEVFWRQSQQNLVNGVAEGKRNRG